MYIIIIIKYTEWQFHFSHFVHIFLWIFLFVSLTLLALSRLHFSCLTYLMVRRATLCLCVTFYYIQIPSTSFVFIVRPTLDAVYSKRDKVRVGSLVIHFILLILSTIYKLKMNKNAVEYSRYIKSQNYESYLCQLLMLNKIENLFSLFRLLDTIRAQLQNVKLQAH